MRWPWSRRDGRPVHANEPHAFQPTRDAGMGTGLGGLSMTEGGSMPAQVAITNRYLRMKRCDVPGCGRSADDPIHQPAE